MRRINVRRVIVAVVLLIAASVAIHHSCVVPFQDNLVMRDVEERMSIMDTVDSFRASQLARLNLADLDRVASSRRLDPAWYMYVGANCELLDRWEDAAKAYTDALAIDQRPEIYFNRGLVMLHLGRMAEAETDMIRAVRFNPFFADRISGELRARVEAGAGLP